MRASTRLPGTSLAPHQGVKIAVVMNGGAGGIGNARSEERAREILEACARAKVEATVHVCDPARLAQTTCELADAEPGLDAIVAAGGDGTASAVAGALVGRSLPLAVIPLGTLNHFARDIGMPIGDLDEAIAAISAYQARRIDVGEVNGRVFLNNSSIGLYPEFLIARDADRGTTDHSRWRAMLRAAARVLRRFPLLRVRIATRDGILAARTPFVFIGNNEYALDLLELGERPAIDRGLLSLYMVRSTSRFEMFWLMVRAMLQRLDAAHDFEAHTIREAVITTGKHRLRVAVDGEVVEMAPPLHYRSRPQALRILVAPPVAHAGHPRAAQRGDPPRRGADAR